MAADPDATLLAFLQTRTTPRPTSADGIARRWSALGSLPTTDSRGRDHDGAHRWHHRCPLHREHRHRQQAFGSLLAAAIAWVAVHIGVAGTRLRDRIVARIGEAPFRGLFVLASFALLGWLGGSFAAAGPVQGLWVAPRWLAVLMMLLMLPALLLFVGSVSTPNPTSVTGARALEAANPATGVLRITRHPMLWAFALWGVVHLVVLGTLSATVLTGAIIVTALAGMPSLDAKVARRSPGHWLVFAAATSRLPFVAIAQGRNRLVWSEIGWWRTLLAIVLWGALIALHPWAFGVDPARYLH